MTKNFLPGLIALSLISTTNLSPIPNAEARSPVRVDPDKKPPWQNLVHCDILGSDYETSRPTGRKVSQGGNYRSAPVGMPAPLYVPAPPPPVSPPPVQAQESRADGTVVTGTRVRPGPHPYPQPIAVDVENRETYDGKPVASIQRTAEVPVSTFSVDVDTGSYANVRRMLNDGQMPPEASVRTEEMINYFRYDYPVPRKGEAPFSITTDMAVTPWNKETRLLRIGLNGYDLPKGQRPPANLVFLIDVSGSMSSPDKLDLVKTSLTRFADRLGPNDKVSIVVYAGTTGLLLEPTSNKSAIKHAVGCLTSAGSTAGGSAIDLAYKTARGNFRDGAINRIILATDGDFNVGITDRDQLKEKVKRERDSGVTLTTLGFGTGNYNDALMEQLADVGNGNYAYIDSESEAEKVLGEQMNATLFTIAKDVKVQVEFNPALVSQYRLIGYENRALAEEDFNNDAVDAGDIGAGHQVTALYEVVLKGAPGWLPDRRYDDNQPTELADRRDARGGEIAFVKLRYKKPQGDNSILIERPVNWALAASAGAPTGDLAFAIAVAGFGQRLRDDKYLNGWGYADVLRLAGNQRDRWRSEFVSIVDRASRGSAARGR